MAKVGCGMMENNENGKAWREKYKKNEKLDGEKVLLNKKSSSKSSSR
jgi:hypothetical protein